MQSTNQPSWICLNIHSIDWFKGKFKLESPMIFVGKSMVSGWDFPWKTTPLIVMSWDSNGLRMWFSIFFHIYPWFHMVNPICFGSFPSFSAFSKRNQPRTRWKRSSTFWWMPGMRTSSWLAPPWTPRPGSRAWGSSEGRELVGDRVRSWDFRGFLWWFYGFWCWFYWVLWDFIWGFMGLYGVLWNSINYCIYWVLDGFSM